MTDGYIWAVVIGMAVANFAVRIVPVAVLSRLRLPRPVERWLSYIPVSVMAALVVGEVLRPGGDWRSLADNPYLLAAIPTALIYHRWRSFLGATVAGVLFFLAFRALLG
ncbi:MAG: AzlD domain-containing protein [Anaerosomatales bacterium]|nr:AzlD domain-containing protein [Anaerosomatales bacterium]